MDHLDKNECVYKLSSSVKTNRGVGKIAMTQKRLFLLPEGRPGYVEIATFRNIEVRLRRQPVPSCLPQVAFSTYVPLPLPQLAQLSSRGDVAPLGQYSSPDSTAVTTYGGTR